MVVLVADLLADGVDVQVLHRPGTQYLTGAAHPPLSVAAAQGLGTDFIADGADAHSSGRHPT